MPVDPENNINKKAKNQDYKDSSQNSNAISIMISFGLRIDREKKKKSEEKM